MGWKIWATEWTTTGQMEDASIFQPILFPRNVILRATRTWIVAYNDPVFTSLSMKIYSNQVVSGINTPKKLLHTSTDVRTKAEIFTLPNAAKEIYFNFDDVPLREGDTYNFVINAVGYVPVNFPDPDASLLAWRKGYPDPIYTASFKAALDIVERAPFSILFIGADA